MDPVTIDWSGATVSGTEGIFDLEVPFAAPSPEFWWEAFSHALEMTSREVRGARWQSIRGVGEPPRGLHVSGIDEGTVAQLRAFLDASVARANAEAGRARHAREERRLDQERRSREATDTAARLTEAFRSGSAA